MRSRSSVAVQPAPFGAQILIGTLAGSINQGKPKRLGTGWAGYRSSWDAQNGIRLSTSLRRQLRTTDTARAVDSTASAAGLRDVLSSPQTSEEARQAQNAGKVEVQMMLGQARLQRFEPVSPGWRSKVSLISFDRSASLPEVELQAENQDWRAR
jgi:hypothetical protein